LSLNIEYRLFEWIVTEKIFNFKLSGIFKMFGETGAIVAGLTKRVLKATFSESTYSVVEPFFDSGSDNQNKGSSKELPKPKFVTSSTILLAAGYYYLDKEDMGTLKLQVEHRKEMMNSVSVTDPHYPQLQADYLSLARYYDHRLQIGRSGRLLENTQMCVKKSNEWVSEWSDKIKNLDDFPPSEPIIY
jgi:hypothetical protein